MAEPLLVPAVGETEGEFFSEQLLETGKGHQKTSLKAILLCKIMEGEVQEKSDRREHMGLSYHPEPPAQSLCGPGRIDATTLLQITRGSLQGRQEQTLKHRDCISWSTKSQLQLRAKEESRESGDFAMIV